MTNNRFRINYSYLRPLKANSLREWSSRPFEKTENLDVWRGKDATILPLKRLPGDGLLFGRAGVVDANGEYVDISAIKGRVEFAYPLTDPEYRDERVIYCGYWVKHWGHFLVETAARLWYALESSEKIIFVTDEGKELNISGNYKEFLELLGVYDRIEIINKPTKFREVLVPELGYKRSGHFSDRFKSIFARVVENVVTPDGWSGPDKIYLSRSHLKSAVEKEYGHNMLDNFFAKNGYQVVHPQEITLGEFILLLQNCTECASFSGTLPHNMLLASDGAKLTIVERHVLNNDIQLDINRMKYLDVTYIDANLMLYPINPGYGPFVMAYNQQMEKFAKDNGYIPPDRRYAQTRYYQKGLAAYMKEYRKGYWYQWYMEGWMIKYTDYMYEAYSDSQKYFGDYTVGRKPFMLHHYFMPYYWKQFVKRILGR